MKSLMFYVFLILLLLSLSCGSGAVYRRSELATKAKTELLGKTKREILTCAGAPIRSQNFEDLELLTYFGGGDYIDNSPNVTVSVGRGRSSGSSGINAALMYCEATFILKDGKVEQINYAGRTGIKAKDEQCGFIVENCVEAK
jgi:hypothetical protein